MKTRPGNQNLRVQKIPARGRKEGPGKAAAVRLCDTLLLLSWCGALEATQFLVKKGKCCQVGSRAAVPERCG